MAKKHLHIVSFDVPYPADYGGVVDVFYKIKALHEAGVFIHLHCFEYGRGVQTELEKYCKEIFYYPRQEGHKGFSLQLPYIVSSRHDDSLWQRLNADAYPVLFEGVHSTYGLTNGLLKKKKMVAVRLHNTEHEYYKQLGKWEGSMMRKAYMHNESRLLKRYEAKLKEYKLFAISEDDVKKYRKQFKARNIEHLPAFIPNTTVTSKEGNGNFVLYHGNLSVAENEKAATWLLEKVFHQLDIPFVIAGKNPSQRLIELSHKRSHTCIVANPGEKEMNDLIEKAQVHLLPSFTDSGIKLKLLNALFSGRHVIANDLMIKSTGLESCCQLANHPTEIKYQTFRLFHKAFAKEEIEKRKNLLEKFFSNEKHAAQLIQALR